MAAAVLGLAACSSGGSAQTLVGDPSGQPVALPSAGVSTRAATASAFPNGTTAVLVLRAYTGYWAAQVKALDSGTVVASGLQTYSTGSALSAAYSDSLRLTRDGLVMSGAPHNDPRVSAIGPVAAGSGVQTATVDDCLDVTDWHQVDAKTHQLKDPAQRLTRYRIVVSARTVGGVWMISGTKSQTGTAC